jgi:serine/threonine protein kinase
MSLVNNGNSSVQGLAYILNDIGASEYLQVFIDDGLDDSALKNLSKLKTERISSIYGLSLEQAAAFAEKCLSVSLDLGNLPELSRAPSNALSPSSESSSYSGDSIPVTKADDQQQSLLSSSNGMPSHANESSITQDLRAQGWSDDYIQATLSHFKSQGNVHFTVVECTSYLEKYYPPVVSSGDSSFVAPVVNGSAADDATIMRLLHMEMIRELGKGGFGTVYEVKNLTDRLKVALKIVKDPQNAIHAIREGQRLRRVKHKNIVLMHKVHDIGDGCCALEMEIVPGGDLFQHLEACRRTNVQLPHDAVIRLSRQLLEALVYLHDELKWLHGDIKPQNILMQCSPATDGYIVDYRCAEIKLADFGLAKILDQKSAASSLMLSTTVGMLKGTMLYLSPEAIQGASSGKNYVRAVSDDLWSACLVILEMDTGMPIHQLMTGPGSVVIEVLLTKASPELLPLLCAVLSKPSAASRCNSAAELLRMLDASTNPLFNWQCFDVASHKYVPVHPASSFFLEEAFSSSKPFTALPLPPPLDLIFDIQAVLSSPAALGYQTSKHSGNKSRIRRILRASVLNSSQTIPVWKELVNGKEWLQCSPALCAKLDIDAKNPNAFAINAEIYRAIKLEPSSLDRTQLPHSMKTEPYLAAAHADDITMLKMRVHDSLPEWDITAIHQVVNASLASKYAAYRHRVAARCNGNPNERMMFHFAEPAVMTKIWQQGEGHDPRLSNWAEVGKGAYFAKHVIYCYAYKYCLWPCESKSEPPIGESMQLFASLVCLGNVADVGPGCETCPSPTWDAWKKELPIMPKPTRPPAMTLSVDAAEKQHILDLTQVKDAPRYDSVVSTEGDLGTHPASTFKDASGRRISDLMHPRLKARAKEWAEQCVVFDAAASYPMFIVTLTKTRDSPFGFQELIGSECDVHTIKSLGYTASQVMALGKSVPELLAQGWPALDLKNAGINAQSLLAGGYSAGDLKKACFTASEMKNCGCNLQQLKTAGYSPRELKDAGFESVVASGHNINIADLRAAGCSYEELVAGGCTDDQMIVGGFCSWELFLDFPLTKWWTDQFGDSTAPWDRDALIVVYFLWPFLLLDCFLKTIFPRPFCLAIAERCSLFAGCRRVLAWARSFCFFCVCWLSVFFFFELLLHLSLC